VNPDGGVDGHGESDALVAAAAAGDHRVDANHFAIDVGEWAAAVAGGDGGVGLNEVLEARRVTRDVAGNCAHDTCGDRGLEAKRRTDSNRPVARLQRVGVADLRGRQVLTVDVDNGEVGIHI